MKESTSKSHYLKFDSDSHLYSLAPLHRRQREMQILILNPQHDMELYRTVVQKYPNAQITTVGDTDRNTKDEHGVEDGTTHLRLRFHNVSEYSLYTTLGSPRVDIMIINPSTYVHSSDLRVRFAEETQKGFERMFALFRMVSPRYWMFTISKDPSKHLWFEQSYLSQHLDRSYFQGQVWTNLEHKFDLCSPKGYSRMLPFRQLRNDLASDERHEDLAVYS